MILGRREDNCVQCPTSPSCNCKTGETCTLSVQTCAQCPQVICTPDESNSSTAGPIAGGVIGGLAVIGILISIYLWWRRKNMRANAIFEPNLSPIMEKGDMRDTRAYSIDSVNTTQARGSNVIPIAYIPGVTAISEQQQGRIRGSVATSDYRASLPDFVMVVHGQPSLVEIGALSRNGSGHSQYVPGPVGSAASAASAGPSAGPSTGLPAGNTGLTAGLSGNYLSQNTGTSLNQSIYDELGLDELTAPFGVDAFETTANSGKSMVTIPEDPEEDTVGTAHRAITGVPRMRNYNQAQQDRQSTYPVRQSSMRQASNDRTSARYSRNSSVREYNMNIPEEAYLYYHMDHTEE